MVAIECGYRDITKLLLEHKGLDLNEKARNGMLPLGKGGGGVRYLRTTTMGLENDKQNYG